MSGDALDVLYDGRDFHELISERIDTKNTHGTGCTISAAIATGLAQGMDVFEAVKKGKGLYNHGYQVFSLYRWRTRADQPHCISVQER